MKSIFLPESRNLFRRYQVSSILKSSKIHYRFQGQMRACKDIFQSCKHRRGRSRYLLSVPVEICEVFFKTCKSVLRLTKECRSLSYDAMCAQTAIVFMRYLFLAVCIREDRDQRIAGPLFCLVSEELAGISVAAAFEKLQLFLRKLLEGFISQKEEICALVIDFLATLPEEMRRFLNFEGVKCISAT